jgi:hypothetical protein
MFTNDTVFILGAGASWHYGYPTGEGLVTKVVEKDTYVSRYFEYSVRTINGLAPRFIFDTAEPSTPLKEKWETALRNCEELKAGLQHVNPLVIDYFLGWNPKLQPIGRLLIAWVILECEYLRIQTEGNINRKEALLNSPLQEDRIRSNTIDLKKHKDDWCRFVIHQLVINCKASSDIFQNNVRFVTFNYDVSLERALHQGLRHIQFLQAEDVRAFLAADRIVHVYGKVRENPAEAPPRLKWSEQARDPKDLSDNPRAQHLYDFKDFLDHIYAASRGIRVIDPDDKQVDKNAIETATKFIAEAKRVYVLGYGFDENNSVRIGLPKSLHYGTSNKSVMFTNYYDINRVNKRASKIFFGSTDHFSPGSASVEAPRNGYYEKSIRDVYESLELDFEALD